MDIIKKRTGKKHAFEDSGSGLFIVGETTDQVQIRFNTSVLTITFCGAAGDSKYKLGFNGPKSFNIHRVWNPDKSTTPPEVEQENEGA